MTLKELNRTVAQLKALDRLEGARREAEFRYACGSPKYADALKELFKARDEYDAAASNFAP